jgi:hypothetical protein
MFRAGRHVRLPWASIGTEQSNQKPLGHETGSGMQPLTKGLNVPSFSTFRGGVQAFRREGAPGLDFNQVCAKFMNVRGRPQCPAPWVSKGTERSNPNPLGGKTRSGFQNLTTGLNAISFSTFRGCVQAFRQEGAPVVDYTQLGREIMNVQGRPPCPAPVGV